MDGTEIGLRRHIARAPMVPLLIAALIGIVAAESFVVSFATTWSVAALAWLLWLAARSSVDGRVSGRCRHFVAGTALCVATAGLFAARHVSMRDWQSCRSVTQWAAPDAPVQLRGYVLDMQTRRVDALELGSRDESVQVEFAVSAMVDGQTWRDVDGRVTLSVPDGGNALYIGAGCEVAGRWRQSWRETGNGRRFVPIGSTRREWRVAVPNGRLVSPWPDRNAPFGVVVASMASRLRAGAGEVLATYLPRHAGLARAMLLGERGQVTPPRYEAFQKSGMAHVLAISGLHLGMLLSWLFVPVRIGWIPRRPALSIVIVGAACYAFLVGGRAPVVRASVLIQIACMGWLLFRPVVVWNSLAAAALGMLWSQPSGLFALGFQLSFLAVAALAWFGQGVALGRRDPIDLLVASFAPPWWRLFDRSRWRLFVLLRAGLSVWAITVPWVIYHIGILALAAPLLSPLIGPFVLAALCRVVVSSCSVGCPGCRTSRLSFVPRRSK